MAQLPWLSLLNDARPPPHHAPVRVLPHIKKLDEALGDFLVRVTCPCRASRHIEPEPLARIVGRSVTLAKLATRMRCSQCGRKVPRSSRRRGRGRGACRRIRIEQRVSFRPFSDISTAR